MNDSRIRVANPIRHGINRNDILPCKKKRCFYVGICDILDQLGSYNYGDPCPKELALVQEMADAFMADLSHAENADLKALIRDLIIAELQIRRVENTIAIIGDMFDNREGRNNLPILPKVVLRYYRDISARNIKLLLKAKELKEASFLLS